MQDNRKAYVRFYHEYVLVSVAGMSDHMITWCIVQGYIEPVVNEMEVSLQLTEMGKVWLYHTPANGNGVFTAPIVDEDSEQASAAAPEGEYDDIINVPYWRSGIGSDGTAYVYGESPSNHFHFDARTDEHADNIVLALDTFRQQLAERDSRIAELEADSEKYYRWSYQLLVGFAKHLLAKANDEREEGAWPAGQEWSDLVPTSQSIFKRQARDLAGIDHDEYLIPIRSGLIEVDDRD